MTQYHNSSVISRYPVLSPSWTTFQSKPPPQRRRIRGEERREAGGLWPQVQSYEETLPGAPTKAPGLGESPTLVKAVEQPVGGGAAATAHVCPGGPGPPTSCPCLPVCHWGSLGPRAQPGVTPISLAEAGTRRGSMQARQRASFTHLTLPRVQFLRPGCPSVSRLG